MRTLILSLPALACLLSVCEAFVPSGILSAAFAPSAARVQLACPLSSPAIARAVPALRGARNGVLGAKAVEFSVTKGDEVKGGGNKYTFTVTVSAAMSKDSYSKFHSDAILSLFSPFLCVLLSVAQEECIHDLASVFSCYHEGFQEECAVPWVPQGHDPTFYDAESEAICYSRLP